MKKKFDVRQFISLIKSKESIWNFKSEEYCNRLQRRKDWMAICEQLVPNFTEKKNGEKCGTVLEFQNKWKVLRDGFVRSLKNYVKKAEQNEKGKLYPYFDEMDFLMAFYEDKKAIIKNTEAQYKDHYLEADESSEKAKKPRKQSERPAREPLTVSSDDEQDDASQSEPETKVPRMTHNLPEAPETYSNTEDDKLFLLSLLSDFRKITEDQKLDCKGDIINVIRHYRNKASSHLETRGSYFSDDIAALATTAIETTHAAQSHDHNYYENTAEDSSRDSESSLEIKVFE